MILLYIITPCVALNAFQLERTADTVRMMELSLLSTVILSGLCVILGGLISKPFHLDVVEAASDYVSKLHKYGAAHRYLAPLARTGSCTLRATPSCRRF